MAIATTQEQQALQAALRDWAKRAAPVALVRALEPGAAEPSAAEPSAARPSAAQAVAERFAELSSLGVFAIPRDGGTVTDLAAALEVLAAALAPGPVLPAALAALLLAGSGRAADCVTLTPGTLAGVRQPDGTLRVAGETTPLLWSAGHLLASTEDGTWFLIDQATANVTVTRLAPLDFSRELATVRVDAAIPPEDLLTLDTGRVRDLAATLFAAEAAGVAAWCTETATGYAQTRRQFGRLIGEFQAVKHLCATMACRAERAAVLAWDAARAADEAPAELPLAAAAAAALALDDAVDNAKDCIQVLGGIGFTWEHDAHLYLRRALALRQLLGGSRAWRTRTAALAAAGATRQVRTQARDDSPYPGIGAWAGPAIENYGTQEQKARFLGPTKNAEITWCQLFSEPEAGSDLASLRTGATRTATGWSLKGQKVWTSLAHDADWAICLARTDPGVPRHQGITYFLVDMRAPGIDIRPLREITGRQMFNEVFLDDVPVPDDCVLGSPGDGWRIAMSTRATERVAIGAGRDEAVRKLLAVAHPDYAERTGLHVATGHSVALLGERGAHPAIRKLIGTAHRQAVAETALEMAGPPGAAEAEEGQEFLLTRCLSIAGGTTQVLLNQVAERVLGLPR